MNERTLTLLSRTRIPVRISTNNYTSQVRVGPAPSPLRILPLRKHRRRPSPPPSAPSARVQPRQPKISLDGGLSVALLGRSNTARLSASSEGHTGQAHNGLAIYA